MTQAPLNFQHIIKGNNNQQLNISENQFNAL